jgi:hypothetical protein
MLFQVGVQDEQTNRGCFSYDQVRLPGLTSRLCEANDPRQLTLFDTSRVMPPFYL